MKLKADVARYITTKDIVTPYKTLEKAAEEIADYEFLRVGTGITVCTHGDKAYAIIERDGEIGCSCEAWTYAHNNDGCKHVAAFLKRSKPAQKPIPEGIAKALISQGWTGGKGDLRPPEATSYPDGEDNEGSLQVPDETATVENQKEEPKMATEEEEKKTYTYPDGTKFKSAEALLDYVESLKAAQSTPSTPERRGRRLNGMIKGISPQLQEIGRIAVGEKGGMSKSGKARLPTKLDHFIFTTLQKDDDDRYIRDPGMMRMFGDDCTEIPIRLLYNDIELNFPTFYAKYARSGIKLRGDGENWIVYNADGTREDVFDPNNERGFLDDPDVKPHGILTVLVEGQNSVGGVYKFRTTSWNSINNILSSLSVIKNMCGMLTYIPLKLVYRKKDVQPKGMAQKTWIPVVSVEFRGTIEELQAQATEVRKYVTAGQRAEIQQIETAVREHLDEAESIEEQQDVAAEFAPNVED